MARPTGAALAARIALLVGLAAWTWHLASQPMAVAAASILHLVNLPFHEAGHVLFMPFGRFMTTLGGSLMQIVVPLVCAGVLLVKTRDQFGASVATWWCGENFLDLAPYIDDARSLQLVLLGGYTGAEVEGHDWEAILTRLGWLHLDHALARGARVAGLLVMVAALAWAVATLTRARATSGADSLDA